MLINEDRLIIEIIKDPPYVTLITKITRLYTDIKDVPTDWTIDVVNEYSVECSQLQSIHKDLSDAPKVTFLMDEEDTDEV